MDDAGIEPLGAARAWAAGRGASDLEPDSAPAGAEAHRFSEREGARSPSLSFGWYGIDPER